MRKERPVFNAPLAVPCFSIPSKLTPDLTHEAASILGPLPRHSFQHVAWTWTSAQPSDAHQAGFLPGPLSRAELWPGRESPFQGAGRCSRLDFIYHHLQEPWPGVPVRGAEPGTLDSPGARGVGNASPKVCPTQCPTQCPTAIPAWTRCDRRPCPDVCAGFREHLAGDPSAHRVTRQEGPRTYSSNACPLPLTPFPILPGHRYLPISETRGRDSERS